MSKEAMKLALEALENWVEYFPQNVDDIDKKAITSMREELSKPDFWEGYVPEPVKPAQQEPVAWTSWRELAGARHYRTPGWEMYADKHNPDDVALYTSPLAQPVQDNPLDCGVYLGSGKDHAIKNHVSYGPEQPVPDAFEQLMREADKPTQVLQDGVAEYVDALINGTHEITSVTIRPKRTWQGLTQDEIADLAEHYYEDKVVQVEEAIEMAEAKLRERNT